MLNRRDLLRTSGAAALALGLSGFPLGWRARAADGKKKKLLVYTRSAGFQHSVVTAQDPKTKQSKTPLVHEIWTKLADKHGFEVHCTKDGRVFLPESLKQFDAFFFYTTGDLTAEESKDGSPPMPKEGKKALLDAIAAGKGFLGSHCASDTFHSKGQPAANQDEKTMDPYIAMLGGEFISHGAQQKATMHVVDPKFPGVNGHADFTLLEEWYSLKNFAPDLHVILANETKGMHDWQYERAAFPATWARMHHKGRVYFTSMGHREDVWENPLFQQMLLGALSWATGQAEADITPNIQTATPKAMELPKPPPPRRDRGKAKAKGG
jgi:type 1 glutamine amidotransferase